MNVNDHLKELRENRGYTPAELAHRSHVSENHIRSIEKGKSQPTVYVLLQLLEALNIRPEEFFKEDKEVVYPTDYEKELIEACRRLHTDRADVLLLLAKMLAT